MAAVNGHPAIDFGRRAEPLPGAPTPEAPADQSLAPPLALTPPDPAKSAASPGAGSGGFVGRGPWRDPLVNFLIGLVVGGVAGWFSAVIGMSVAMGWGPFR